MPFKILNSLSGKLYGLAFFFSMCFVVMLDYQLYTLHTNLDAFKRTEIRSVGKSARSIAAGFAAKAKAGEMTVEEVKARTKEAISSIRYASKSYVFVYQSDGNTVIHPVHALGKSRHDARNPQGRYLVREFIDVVNKQGSGYVDYGQEDKNGDFWQ
ncbi:cache domain-containing protein [Breoghania sp.]|uniref:cache domain-containing protein n=1 Tax=Breoghania sp. TaxID=2065378 RepID=UPI0026354263|nr:cache domain-containing protein [Breoghania sp.]MDJ0929712.1 cache domain-containing protein [Breoghania sp.]